MVERREGVQEDSSTWKENSTTEIPRGGKDGRARRRTKSGGSRNGLLNDFHQEPRDGPWTESRVVSTVSKSRSVTSDRVQTTGRRTVPTGLRGSLNFRREGRGKGSRISFESRRRRSEGEGTEVRVRRGSAPYTIVGQPKDPQHAGTGRHGPWNRPRKTVHSN